MQTSTNKEFIGPWFVWARVSWPRFECPNLECRCNEKSNVHCSTPRSLVYEIQHTRRINNPIQPICSGRIWIRVICNSSCNTGTLSRGGESVIHFKKCHIPRLRLSSQVQRSRTDWNYPMNWNFPTIYEHHNNTQVVFWVTVVRMLSNLS